MWWSGASGRGKTSKVGGAQVKQALGLKVSLGFILHQEGLEPLLKQGFDLCWTQSILGAVGKWFVGNRNANSKAAQKLFCSQIIAHWNLFRLGVMPKRHSLHRHILDDKFRQRLLEHALWLILSQSRVKHGERTSHRSHWPYPLAPFQWIHLLECIDLPFGHLQRSFTSLHNRRVFGQSQTRCSVTWEA